MLRGSIGLSPLAPLAPPAPPATPAPKKLSFMCNLIIGIGVLNAVQKFKAIAKSPEYSTYLGTIAIIDAATLYMMLGYCREGRTMEGFFKTVVLESILRSVAAAALESPPTFSMPTLKLAPQAPS